VQPILCLFCGVDIVVAVVVKVVIVLVIFVVVSVVNVVVVVGVVVIMQQHVSWQICCESANDDTLSATLAAIVDRL
jgi:hypothetical protein